MPLYNQSETPITGSVTTYQRAELLVLRNQDPPVIECHESLRSVYPGGEVRNQSLGILGYTAEDLDEKIPMIDPATFEPIPGQDFTAGQFYLMAASIYMNLARQRDSKALELDAPTMINPTVGQAIGAEIEAAPDIATLDAIIASIPTDPRWPA